MPWKPEFSVFSEGPVDPTMWLLLSTGASTTFTAIHSNDYFPSSTETDVGWYGRPISLSKIFLSGMVQNLCAFSIMLNMFPGK